MVNHNHASDNNAPLCELWKLHEPDWSAPWRYEDQRRYDAGIPWHGTTSVSL
jgi:hypothetical protein